MNRYGEHVPLEEWRKRAAYWAARTTLEGAFANLPGAGMYAVHRGYASGVVILQAAEVMAESIGPERTAEALRRLAAKVERGDFDGASA